MFHRLKKGIYKFAANLLSYIPTKYYWNRSTSDLVTTKSKRVNFFETQCISVIYIMIVSWYFQAKISWYFWYFQNINLYYYYLLTFLINAYLTQTVQVPMLLDGAKIMPKILTLWVGRNNITDDRHRRTAHAIRWT